MPAALRVTSYPAPAALPVSLAEAKDHVYATETTADDGLIARLLAGACADAGAECGRAFGVTGFAVAYDGFPLCGEPIQLPVRPLVAVASVTYRDADGQLVTLATESYFVGSSTARIAPAEPAWPLTQCRRPESVEVAFTAGHTAADCPPQARDAILLILADRFGNRGDGESDRRPVPPAAARLLWQLHHGGI